MLTKGYFHLDGYHWSGNDDDDGDVHIEDNNNDDANRNSDSGDIDEGDAPDNEFVFKEGGKATGMCFTIQFNLSLSLVY